MSLVEGWRGPGFSRVLRGLPWGLDLTGGPPFHGGLAVSADAPPATPGGNPKLVWG